MNGLALGDRLLTVAVTATLTSAAWIVVGGGILDGFGSGMVSLRKTTTDAAARPSAAAARSTASAHPPREPPPILPVAAAGEFVLPVAGVRPDQLIDTFTAARAGGARVHDAIDIMAPRGTPVLAAASGLVEKLFTSQAGGLTIYIRSPDRRMITYYAHLDSYAAGLAEGQQVRRGQRIAAVGASGNADPAAPHLHFAILQTTQQANWWEPANAVNPYPLLTGRVR